MGEELNKRAGVLLHITSMPENGQMDHHARQFISWMANCGFSVWQVLPLGPTHADGSPYLSLSAHAGNPKLISLSEIQKDTVIADTWLPKYLSGKPEFSAAQLTADWEPLFDPYLLKGFHEFVDTNHHWLDDYAIFMSIRSDQNGKPWWEWPSGLRDRQTSSIADFTELHPHALDAYYIEQFLFDRQWQQLKQQANDNGIDVLGDMPLYVAHDSVDVWSHRDLFALTKDGHVHLQAGVPPDMFAETGQLWGNPVYNWDAHKADNFQWWKERLQTQSRLYNSLRIDHFRGLESYWVVPAGEKTAIDGEWVLGPGAELLSEVTSALPELHLVAEDLGIITEEVDALRKQFDLPGMRIIEFAFDGGDDNPHRIANHTVDSVVYTGTHDNDTVVGWFESLEPESKKTIKRALEFRHDGDALDAVIDAALGSTGELTIIPMQDILGLGGEARMNTPGTVEGNWQWALNWEQLRGISAEDWRQRLKESNRLPS